MGKNVYRLQYFVRNDIGELAAGHVESAANAVEAVRRARLLARLRPGVVVFRRPIELSGAYGPPVRLVAFGDVPEDLTAL